MRKQMEDDRKNVAAAVGLSLGGNGPSMSKAFFGGGLRGDLVGGCSTEVNSDFTRFPCFLLLIFLLNTRETMSKHIRISPEI